MLQICLLTLFLYTMLANVSEFLKSSIIVLFTLFSGGYEIQKQCESFLNYHNISHSDVISGAPGSLHCKRIFHVIIPEWRGGNHKEEELLQTAVKNCIEKLPSEQLSSIAFPAIGTGIFRFPNHKAVFNIVKSIQSSMTDKVKQVYLCCDTEEDFKGFVKEINDQLPDAGLVSVRRTKEETQGGNATKYRIIYLNIYISSHLQQNLGKKKDYLHFNEAGNRFYRS